MTHLRVAVDIGGTFTDICVLDENSGTLEIGKVPTSADPIDAAISGVLALGVDMSDITLFSHGTTVATNALITRNLPLTAMVTTEGFRDVIEIGRSNKRDLWDAYEDNAPPYIRRRDRLTIRERVSSFGEVEIPVDEDAARELARVLRKRGYRSVTVCFMNSFVNPENEREMKRLLEAELPDVLISNSADVLSQIFEHDRFSTAVVNAVVHPVLGDYANRMQTQLADGGYAGDLLLLHSGGGVMTPKTIERHAARLAGSGIAAGAVASKYVGELCGFENSIGFDMGGTSTDISLVSEGQPSVTRDWYIEYGHPICFPSIDIRTIGAGGGSIAWVDDAGSLHNGPQSAGANPGPACYRQGGEEPTNSDANLVLGRLGATLAGGDLTLDVERAEQAIAKIGEPFGLSTVEAASAILAVADANMAEAVRVISIARGYDPRDFALVAFGGAGPLHGVSIARELAIPTVVVPPNPGVTSALGCLLVDVQHDLSTIHLADAASADADEIERDFRQLDEEAHERLAKEGVSPEDITLMRSASMRYTGQWRSLDVPVSSPVSSLDEAIAGFEQEHEREYNYRRDGAPIELFRLNLVAIGTTPKAEFKRHAAADSTPEPVTHRSVWFTTDAPVDTPIYGRGALAPGFEAGGPVIVEQLDTTAVVPPGARFVVDAYLNLIISV